MYYKKGINEFEVFLKNKKKHLEIQIMKKTANKSEYKVGINAVIANFVCL